MRRLILSQAFLLAVLLGMPGCAKRPDLSCWFVDSLTKVFPDDAPGANEAGSSSFRTARNAHLSIQLSLRAREPMGDLYVDALPLRGPGMPLESVQVRWVEYVVVTTNTPNTPDEELLRKAPALFPDALLEEFPLTLEKEKTRSVWLTVRVPSNQTPGEYQGELRLRQGKEEVMRIPYTVVVHTARVPSKIPLAVSNHFNLSDRHLQQFYGCAQFTDAWWELMGRFARFLAAYHQTSISANPVTLVEREAIGGGVRYDFSNFERFVETFDAAGVDGHIEGGNLLFRERRRDAPVMVRAWILEDRQPVLAQLPVADPRAQNFLRTFLPALYQRLEQKQWTEKYLQGILDEPRESERRPFVETAETVRRLMPRVKTIEPVGARQDLGFMQKTVDIWIPQLGTFDDKLEVLERHVASGGDLWLYTALSPRGKYPNRFIDYSLTKVRILHWMNFKYNFRGFLHWGGNYWGPEPFKDTQPVINQGRTYLPPGDAYITYPNRSRRALYSSIRLEQMREGIEDFGLLAELEKKDESQARRIADEAVTSFTDYVREPGRFREISRRLLEAF